jgi:succinate dehydrogenase/fumarate reductase flavoprotein subunit
MHPYDKNLFRTGPRLAASLSVLDGAWSAARDHLAGTGIEQLRAREAAAVAANARWCYTAALARGESRGMHRRLDAPDADPALGCRLVTGGLDEIWVRRDEPAVDLADEGQVLAS